MHFLTLLSSLRYFFVYVHVSICMIVCVLKSVVYKRDKVERVGRFPPRPGVLKVHKNYVHLELLTNTILVCNMDRFCVTVFALCVAATYSAKLPSSFKRCHKSDPHFNDCLVVSIEDAIHKLKNGAPELGLDSFEPLLISELVIGQGSGPVNVQQNFKNVKLHGLTGSKVLKHRADWDKNMLYAESITPMLRLEADYDMKGRVLLLPVYGNGKCNVTLVNTKINHTLTGEPFQKKGKTYMKFVDYTVTLRPEIVKFHFADLFNGDDRLGGEINKVINDNWDAVFTDVRDGYEKSFGLIFQDLANRVYTRVALKDIYFD